MELQEFKEYVNTITPTLTSHEKQVVLGSLLGTSSLVFPKRGKHGYLQMRETKSDGRWLLCKAEEVKKLARRTPFVEDTHSIRWVSVASPIWEEFREICYVNGRKEVAMPWLDLLTDFGWAVWYMDKGMYFRNRIYLRVGRLGVNAAKIVSEYFRSLDIDCKTLARNRVVMTEASSKEFIRMIGPCLPKYVIDSAIPSRIPKKNQ